VIRTLIRFFFVCLISFQVGNLLAVDGIVTETTVALHDDHDHDHDHDHDDHDHDGHNHDHDDHDHASHGSEGHHDGDHHEYSYTDYTYSCGTPAEAYHPHGYDPTGTAIHHISDANVYTILDWIRIPLPTILWSKEDGLKTFMSSKFGPGHHDDGHYGYHGYVMHHGAVYRINCPDYRTKDHFEVEGFNPKKTKNAEGKEIDKKYAVIAGKAYELEQKTIWDGGMLGGGTTSFYDLSISKNVVSMILISLLMFWLFRKAATAYYKRDGQAPSGIQSFLEPMVQFIRDEAAIPFIGEKKYERFLPLLLAIFFFILGLNLWGQVPFLGSTNVTGSLTVTMVLAVIVFLVVTFLGNKHYWEHIFWMPGVPVFLKPLLAVVEILGMFIKPLTLMLRLAGNISAGHIAILSFVGLIFIFGNAGESLGGSAIGTALAVPLTLFMMAIELIVAFIQAFVFTILTASYIGAATEDHHDHH